MLFSRKCHACSSFLFLDILGATKLKLNMKLITFAKKEMSARNLKNIQGVSIVFYKKVETY